MAIFFWINSSIQMIEDAGLLIKITFQFWCELKMKYLTTHYPSLSPHYNKNRNKLALEN